MVLLAASMAVAQESSNSGVKRRDNSNRGESTGTPGVSDRMKERLGEGNSSLSEGDMQWMRVIYRELDLTKEENAPLYFPEEPMEDQENMFRIIMRLLASGEIPAYEYPVNGTETFNDKSRVNLRDQLDRFYIYYTEAKGSTEKNPKYEIDENDIPSNEVLSYYIVEKWEFDNRSNRMKTRVDAVCPVLHRAGDFGGETLKYPMFWVKYSDLRPYLNQQHIFISDDNNLPTCTYDDYFTLNMYDGDIYKTRNLRNKSMNELYPDPDDMKRAQDSIQTRLEGFEKKLWVPNREEIIAAREAREAAEVANGKGGSLDEITGAAVASDEKGVRSTVRGEKSKDAKTKKPKAKKLKQSKVKSNSSNATRSVRRTK